MMHFLFDNWSGIWRTLVVGTIAYLSLVTFLRLSGKRTLAKMNAFDFVVTVALGSILATILLSEDVALAEGVVAFALLIVLQYIVAWLSVRSEWVQSLVKSEPNLLFYQGKFLHHALRTERVTQTEIEAAVRQQGITAMSDLEAVVLETDGTFSVLRTDTDADTASSLRSLKPPPDLHG
jgi:uncharacterized membrane protein YcaP (DUF421 family)